MKALTNTLKKNFSALWKDESAQGATEYILLLVVVVSVVLMFKGRIMTAIGSKMSDIEGGMSSLKPDGN